MAAWLSLSTVVKATQAKRRSDVDRGLGQATKNLTRGGSGISCYGAVRYSDHDIGSLASTADGGGFYEGSTFDHDESRGLGGLSMWTGYQRAVSLKHQHMNTSAINTLVWVPGILFLPQLHQHQSLSPHSIHRPAAPSSRKVTITALRRLPSPSPANLATNSAFFRPRPSALVSNTSGFSAGNSAKHKSLAACTIVAYSPADPCPASPARRSRA